ncbi:NAD(P) transhydrogenase subunit alpha [Candidatus Foliamicus sp.]
MPPTIGVLRETAPGERRVAMVPKVLVRMNNAGLRVIMEQDAGLAASFADADYKDAEIEPSPDRVAGEADVLFCVGPPPLDRIAKLKQGAMVVGLLNAYAPSATTDALCERGVTAFSMELVPRISRAQSMDVLSSQASVAGYKAVLMAADQSQKFLPMLTTAAGTISPARVLVLGAGVAGLQAIATARRLGAVVEAYDVREETREQVESLGARFVDAGVSATGEGGYARELTGEEKALQQEALDRHIAASDILITTAAVPGRPSPRIVSAAAVNKMRRGAVIVDLAAEGGGNCELSRAGETIDHQGVCIMAPLKVPAMMARHASAMYSRNLFNFIKPAIREEQLSPDLDDPVFAGTLLTHSGEIRYPGARREETDGD